MNPAGMEKVRLLGCPFCGGEAVLKSRVDVHCTRCFASIGVHIGVFEDARLVDAWNTRPTPSPAADEAGLVEAIRAVIRQYVTTDLYGCLSGTEAAARAILPLIRAAVEAERRDCERLARHPGFIEARDTEWDEGVNYAKRFIGDAIRDRDSLAGGE